MKKRVLALLLAGVMALGLAACGGDNSANNSTPPASQPAGTEPAETGSGEAVELSLWAFNIGGFTEASNWDSLIAAFNEANPDIKVTVTPINYQDGDQKLTSAITSGSGPDIIFEGPERIVGNYAREGLMVDLGDVWGDASADIGENISSVCQLDGTYYMYPLSAAAHCMAINYEVFEAAGALQYIDEETRTWTTDDFVKACEALRDAGYSVPGIVYCGGTGGDQGTRALVRNLYSADFTDAEHTKYTMNSENGIKGLQLLIDMVNDKSMTYDAGIVASDELTLFANGTSCMSLCWNASNWANYASQTNFTPFAMTFPSDDGQPELDGGIWGFGIVDKGDQAKIDAAKTFIDFVCNDESQASDSVYATGFFPVRSSLGDIYAGTEKEGYSEFMMFMPYLGDYYNVTPKWAEQRTAWFEMLQAAFSSGDAASALAEYDTKANG